MNERPVADRETRERALEAGTSFIVQAPAGAGKTGLLIQRYLRLLATVRRPEEILAVTFTRKAAGEMKRRVLEALAASRAPLPAGASPHARRTHALAQAALERDEALGWQVLENTARLRIQTIDSFNASLTRRMPVLSGLGTPPALVDDAREHYREAALRTLALVTNDRDRGPSVERLLAHLDGDQVQAANLLALMLARRDQWLGRDWEGRLSREALEAAFRSERAARFARAKESFPAGAGPVLFDLLDYAFGQLDRLGIEPKHAASRGLASLPSCDEAGAGAWAGLRHFLQTGGGTWRARKGLNRTLGFPSAKEGGREDRKDEFASLVGGWDAQEAWRASLADLAALPPPAFTEAQWQALEAVVALLPVAAGQLKVVFAERGEADHAEIAEGAVRALGTEDSPTDLLLALDERLSHLLVDEFQDTSRSQWSLLAALTAGWEPGDGRTVFAVGDPMQSIYRFREADVALFLRAWQEGLPHVRLEPLGLTTNFRSQRGLVDWVNGAFARILPERSLAGEGAVSLAPSGAFHDRLEGEAVAWHAFIDEDLSRSREAEAARVAELAGRALREGHEAGVAILVRNRTHLDRIAPALRAAGIPFSAVDIDPLAERQAVRDLVALACALAHPADRVAWLAVLRAPWCGLTLAQLHALAGGDERTIPEILEDGARAAGFDDDGRERLGRVREVLRVALAGHLRGTLRERVERAWLDLGGPACLASESELADAESFFERLDEIAEADELPDPARLAGQLEDLYGAPAQPPGDGVQVMTIHKAKGLEFGTVIVPGLDRVPRGEDTPLFRWKARADGALLMAPVKEAGVGDEPANDFLRELDARESGHEAERLLYVAATRAIDRLHLLGCAKPDEDEGAEDRPAGVRRPASRSLLGKAWAVAQEAFANAPQRVDPVVTARLPGEPADGVDVRWLVPAALEARVDDPATAAPAMPAASRARVEFSWAGETARLVGTVAHRWLQRIAEEGLAAWSPARVEDARERVREDLACAGVPASQRETCATEVLASLVAAITDERGRWILASRPSAGNELRVRVMDEGRVRLLVMDRVFVDEGGRRWVVDYKTSRHEGGDPEAFLDRERERYAEKMRAYARAVGEGPGLGLYFPRLPGWREVDG